MYLTKAAYAGTTSIFVTIGNAVKAVPWLLLVKPADWLWMLGALCLPAIPLGVWAGWRLPKGSISSSSTGLVMGCSSLPH
jgi:uncharacterized protein